MFAIATAIPKGDSIETNYLKLTVGDKTVCSESFDAFETETCGTYIHTVLYTGYLLTESLH